MAKKRRVRKSSRRIVRKKTKSVSKFSIVANNLLLFIALALVSLVLTRFLANNFLTNLFAVMAMVFGVISVAFLITLLVLFVMRAAYRRKKRR
jgi:small-conductance mechanosensitive channel